MAASARARRTWRISLREGGRRRLRDDDAGTEVDWGVLEDADEEPLTGSGSALPEMRRGLTLERSIHSFSAGRAGVVYCERALNERSHFFGIHTPTRMRHAATRRFTLRSHQGKLSMIVGVYSPFVIFWGARLQSHKRRSHTVDTNKHVPLMSFV